MNNINHASTWQDAIASSSGKFIGFDAILHDEQQINGNGYHSLAYSTIYASDATSAKI